MTTSTEQQHWSAFTESLERLGLKLDLHLRQASDDDRAVMENALHRVRESVGDAFDGIKAASHDPAVHEDLQTASTSFFTALAETLDRVGAEVVQVIRSPKPPS
jgi:hypothetical protein